MSSGKNYILTFQHCVIQEVWKNIRLPHLSWLRIQSVKEFSANRRSFQRQCVLICCSTLSFLARSDNATIWLAVKTRDTPYVLKLASGDLTSRVKSTPSASLSRAETDQFTSLQLSLQLFCQVENLWCKLDFKGRVTTNEIQCETKQKQGQQGAAELLP